MYICVCVSEMNGNSDTRNGKKDLGICCYYRVFALAVKRYSVI